MYRTSSVFNIHCGEIYKEFYPDGHLADRIEALMKAAIYQTLYKIVMFNVRSEQPHHNISKGCRNTVTAQFNPRSLRSHDFMSFMRKFIEYRLY